MPIPRPNLSQLTPPLTRVDFQGLTSVPTTGFVKFSASGAKLSIEKQARPPRSHPWIPDPIYFLHVDVATEFSKSSLEIIFEKPVKWVELNAFTNSKNELPVNFVSSSGKKQGATEKMAKNIAKTIRRCADDIQRIVVDTSLGAAYIWDVRYWPKT